MVILKGPKRNRLYYLKGETITPQKAKYLTIIENKSELWHNKMGHIGNKGLKYLSKQKLLGTDMIEPLEFCETCVLEKSHRVSFETGLHTTSRHLDYVHSDLWGPESHPTFGGNKYFLSIVDDCSRKVWTYPLKNKSGTLQKLRTWLKMVENQLNKKLKTLRTDNGLEFCNAEFDNFYKQREIMRYRTVKHTSQQNGVAERMNRTLMNKFRCMLISSRLAKSFWAEAVNTIAYSINKSPCSSVKFKTPRNFGLRSPQTFLTFGCLDVWHMYIRLKES